jgi:hypothetical protein
MLVQATRIDGHLSRLKRNTLPVLQAPREPMLVLALTDAAIEPQQLAETVALLHQQNLQALSRFEAATWRIG